MIKTIRDDVIKLEAYTAAAFKYDEELTRLYEIGGYCLISQLKNRYGESKAKKMIEDMQNHKLISTEYYSNSKYAYITQNALKYLANKDNIKDNINIKKRNIEKFPAERVLIASIMKYETEEELYFVKRSDYLKILKQKISEIKKMPNINSVDVLKLNKENYIKNKDGAKKLIEAINQLLKENSHVQIEKMLTELSKKYDETIEKYDNSMKQSEEIESRMELYTKKAIILFDISKIMLLPKNENTLLLYIVDNTHIKPVKKYFQDIYDFEKNIGILFKNIQIVFISYSSERYKIFNNRVNTYVKRADIRREVKISEITKCYYLKNIVERTVNLGSEEIEIKSKDAETYKKIKEHLNSKKDEENGEE